MSKSKHSNFVAYKESLALSTKSFKEKCDAHYDTDKDLLLGKSMYNSVKQSDGRVDAPTWTQVFSWFTKTYKLASHVDLYNINHLGENYYFKIKNFTDSFEDGAETKAYGFKTPEDAQLACLRKLIEYIS